MVKLLEQRHCLAGLAQISVAQRQFEIGPVALRGLGVFLPDGLVRGDGLLKVFLLVVDAAQLEQRAAHVVWV